VELNPSILPQQPRLEGARVWSSPGAVLVHRQRINTPEDCFEIQPTPAWGGTGAILFDGRLDDRAGLCEQLACPERHSLPDSELVARAFEKWDADAPPRLIGDFALAVWDGRNRRAILCADRSGLRPLYFHSAGGLLVFSNILPALLSVPGVPCALDETALADLLFNNHRDMRCSVFRGVNRVLRGTTVTLRDTTETVAQYWYPEPRPRIVLRRDEEYVEAAREVLDKAVACRTRSIVPVAVRGSGGLDSSAVMVSLLAQTNAPAVALYTTVPEPGMPVNCSAHRYASERSAVVAMQTAFPRLVPRFVEPGVRPDVEYAPERVFEEVAVPIGSVMPSGWAEMTLRRMREEGVTSCLGGHVGNLTLTWEGALSSFFREGHWLRFVSEAAALADYRPLRTARSILGTSLRDLIPAARRQSPWRNQVSLHPRVEAELNMAERLRAAGDRRYVHARDGMELRLQGLTVRGAMAGEVLAWTRARHGVETRDPTGDVRVIDFCMSLPEDQFLRHGETRWLGRRLLRAAGVPREITENTKRGAWCPEWFARLERRRPQFDIEIANLRESPTAGRLIDLDMLSRFVADWPQTPAGVERRRPEFDSMLTRALQVGAFIRWAEARSAASKQSNTAAVTA
jgi:asparagine synthase (glutamine-hydrolysing)